MNRPGGDVCEEPIRSEARSSSLLPAELLEGELEPVAGAIGVSRSILLVEDNPGDIRLVREALRRGPIPLRLTIAHDGLEALHLLQRSGRKPDLILLDLNLPGLDGRAILRRIKTTPDMSRIPVIVLSSSNAHQDVWNAYDQHANCYVVKPRDFEGFERALGRLIEFWVGVVHLPSS